MSTLDAILDRATRFAGAGGGLVTAWHTIAYQKGCGRGRQTVGHRVLLVHNIEKDHWELPLSDAGHSQSGEEFKPKLNPKVHDDHAWIDPDHAMTCTANAPTATAAIKRFCALRADTQPKGVSDSMSTSTADLRRQVAELERRLGPPADPKGVRDAQIRAHRVYELFGDSAPAGLSGEDEAGYIVRSLGPLQKHSPEFMYANLAKVGDVSTLRAIESHVHADAAREAISPRSYLPGQLIPRRYKDQTGREITMYKGDPNACWDQFNPPTRLVRQLLVPGTVRFN